MARQPALFRDLFTPDPAHTNQVRDRALRTVAVRAGRRDPTFQQEAEAFVLRYLERHGPTPGEALSLACKDAGIRPHDDRAFGPVYMALVRAGRIVKAGSVRRERGHGTAGGNVWALAE